MLISEATAFLEDAYNILNGKYFGGTLDPVRITIQSSKRAYGHYTTWKAWDGEDGNSYPEINLGAETLSRPIEQTMGTLLHEMTHHFCCINNIKDTSRGGTYHNKRFKEEAEKRGLIIDYDSRIGWSITHPSPELIEFIQQEGWQKIDLSRNDGYSISLGGDNDDNADGGEDTGEDGEPKKRTGVRKLQCPKCRCSVRAGKEVHIKCMDCDEPMVEVDPPEKGKKAPSN